MNLNYVDISTRIDTIREIKGISITEFSKIIDADESEARAILAAQKKIEIPQFFSFCSSLKISPDRIYKGDVDYQAIEKMNGNEFSSYIPERYLESKGTSTRSLRSVIDCVEGMWGTEVLNTVLHYLELNKESFSMDRQVSFKLVEDLFDRLSRAWLTTDDCLEMGREAKKVMPFFKLIEKSNGSVADALDIAVNEIAPQLEKNFKYKIDKIQGNEAFLEITPRGETLEELKSSEIGSIYTESYADGVSSGLFDQVSANPVNIERIKSASQGDSKGVMKITFN